MALSTVQQDSLKARYDFWGLDAVRREIERNRQTDLTPRDVNAFAHAWVAAEEAKNQRIIRFIKILATVVFSMLGGIIAALLIIM